ncbi:MAG TPA: NAD(P)/FAD-dependent oxidoreductase [Actinomycetota bacterium]|nr:NAD(P)/FAD-dependent oxidoreductase [Actinomycetota bacterium]
MATYDAIVIGAGHNGLVAAAYLGKAGKRVLVLEKRERAGGILDTVEIAPGVRAPGIVHTVGRLRRSVIDDLGLKRHGLELIEPSVRVFAPQPEGPAITLWSDVSKTASGLRERSDADAQGYLTFDKKVRSLASFVAHLNASTPPDIKSPTFADAIAGLRLGRAYKALGPRAGREITRSIAMALADFVGESLQDDALQAAIVSRGLLYTAQAPWSAGSTANLLTDSAGNDGGVAGQSTFAKGGPGALAQALVSAAKSFGVEITTGAEVVAITTRNGRATGVALADGTEISAARLVSAADPKHTIVDLLDPVVAGPHLRWRAGNIRQSGRASKVDLALSGLPTFNGATAEQLRGRIVIGPGIDYLEHAFDHSKYGRISEEPFLEATIPSLSDPTLAPEGQHVMSIVAQWTPRDLREGDWAAERDTLADLAVKTMEMYAPGLGDLVTARHVVTPVDLETEYGLSGGHVLHAEPGLDSWFAWRPLIGHARYRFAVPGLWLAGSGAHPGGGVTGAPGANAAREMLGTGKEA